MRTPLHQATKNNHVDVVRLLVEAGADVNVKDEHLVTPLLLAGSSVNCYSAVGMANFVEIVRILLNKKAFVNSIHSDTGIGHVDRYARKTVTARHRRVTEIPRIRLIRTHSRQEPRLCITRRWWAARKRRNCYWSTARGQCSSAKVTGARPFTSPRAEATRRRSSLCSKRYSLIASTLATRSATLLHRFSLPH